MSDAARTPADEVDEIVQALGFRTVEFHTSVVKGRTQCNLVIYRPEGVGIDDCASVHKTVLPRLELLLDDRDVALQVASPGIERTLKNMMELQVFTGRGVRILKKDSEDWIAGVIQAADSARVELKTPDGTHEIPVAQIRKARLDHTQEVG